MARVRESAKPSYVKPRNGVRAREGVTILCAQPMTSGLPLYVRGLCELECFELSESTPCRQGLK